jgi:hypothetical protein
MTLVELLLAVSIMAIMAGALSGLATAVNQAVAYSQGHGASTQHARVVLERIGRLVSECTATTDYPGVAVVYEDVGGWRFPDLLVIWHPDAAPVNPGGPPLMNELILIGPDPDDPYLLVEVTAPADSRPVPLGIGLNTAAWRAEFKSVARATSSRKVVLTELLRAGETVSGSASSLRGAVRFDYELRPSDAELASARSGVTNWTDLPWPQGIHGSQTGLRQGWLRIELQLLPEYAARHPDPGGQQAIPFLGSAALYYQVRK